MTKYLITGNLGYIGPVLSDIIKYFDDSAFIIGYDTGFFRDCAISPSGISQKCSVDIQYFGDIRDQAFLSSVFETFSIDHVIHLAAISNDPMGKEFESVTNDINHICSVKTAELAIKYSCKSFVFASSCSVYGKGSDTPRREEDPINPLTAYAKSKVDTEVSLNLLNSIATKITCLRFATACGFSPRLRLDLVLNDFVATAVSTHRIDILSDGTPWRPLIDVVDMSKILFWSTQRQCDNVYEIYNAGSIFCNYRVSDLATSVSNFFDFNIKLNINSKAPSDDRSYQVNFEKIHASISDDLRPSLGLIDSIYKLSAGISDSLDAVHPNNRNHLNRLSVLRDMKSKGILDSSLNWHIVQ